MELLQGFLHMFSSDGLRQLIQAGGLTVICLIIFAETGFFALLPGDSLLVLCGIFAATVDPVTGQHLLPIAALLTLVPLCAVLGDQVGYSLGRWAGKKIYTWKERSLLGILIFKPAYLARTEQFYSRWGVFTIVAGRWVPIVRTFAPIVAGVTKMPFTTFITFNVVGAVTWVWSMVLAGYFLPPLLQKVWPAFDLAKNIDKIALVIVFLSVLPIAFTVWRERQEKLDGRAFAAKRKPRQAKAAPKPRKASKRK